MDGASGTHGGQAESSDVALLSSSLFAALGGSCGDLPCSLMENASQFVVANHVPRK